MTVLDDELAIALPQVAKVELERVGIDQCRMSELDIAHNHRMGLKSGIGDLNVASVGGERST